MNKKSKKNNKGTPAQVTAPVALLGAPLESPAPYDSPAIAPALDEPCQVKSTLTIDDDDYLPLEAPKAPEEPEAPVEPQVLAVRRVRPPKQTHLVDKHMGIRGKVDLAKVLDLKYRHKLSHKEIADYFGVAVSSISLRIRKYMEHLPNREEVEALDSIRGDIVRGAFLKNLACLADPSKLKKASLNNVAYSTAQLHNMVRLEEGKSTQNVFTADYFKYIKEQARLESPEKPE